MFVFGVIFIVTTLLILLFKKENNKRFFCKQAIQDEIVEETKHQKISLVSTYKMIWNIIMLVPIRKLVFILLTAKVSKHFHNYFNRYHHLKQLQFVYFYFFQ